ncbi:hypothetical protein CIRMBP1218_02245 [Enterococcus cecorum]|nr:hypothetical protein CIRMBP1218_02245 [Enterococcus cecorum]
MANAQVVKEKILDHFKKTVGKSEMYLQHWGFLNNISEKF